MGKGDVRCKKEVGVSTYVPVPGFGSRPLLWPSFDGLKSLAQLRQMIHNPAF
jgi:hypothetical protein